MIQIKCPDCKQIFDGNLKQCPNCGCPASYCKPIGESIDDLKSSTNSNTEHQRLINEETIHSQHNQTKSTYSNDSSWVNHLNEYVGNDRPVELNWKILFTDVSKKHTSEEAEEIFIVGTRKTTPSVYEVSKDWPHPWLYSRVFMMFAIAFTLLWVCCSIFQNPNALPGLIVVGSFTAPLSTLILFLELNAWRNVSLYEVIKIFFVGGCASLVATLFLFSFFGIHEMDFLGAFLTGFIEETGKAVIVYFFLRRLGKLFILNGLLIGAAVGAGFAAFESAGYAMSYLFQGGWDVMMNIIFLRGFLTPGGHVVWAAISGASLVIAIKEQNKISTNVFLETKFLRLFIIPVILHGIWDSPLSVIGSEVYFVPIGLTVLAWIVVLILINMGLVEVSKNQPNY